MTADPFAYHPELRSRITPAETSFFRTFTAERLLAMHPELEAFGETIFSDAVREGFRTEVLTGHTGDLWIFAYGSLMWDPALRFAEVRRAAVDGYARRMSLFDDEGGRGTPEAPGLMAALDIGDVCEGLAFRVAAEDIAIETEILFRREMLGPAYLPGFVSARIGTEQVQALTFLADRTASMIRPDLTHEEQVRYIATGAGFLGSSRDYLANIVDQFDHLGIEDAQCARLLRDVDAWCPAPATP